MLAFKFFSELGRKNTVILLFLHLILTHDVVTMKGLTMEEVEIAGPPCANCAEIVCTISTIEPDSSDFKYVKYIVDSCQAKILDFVWQDKPNATTFQDCANEANSDESKMFYFNDNQCKVSPLALEKTDQCNVTSYQMVYIEAEADVDEFRRKLTCNYDAIINKCVDDIVYYGGLSVNRTAGSCYPKLKNFDTYDSEYIFFSPDYQAPRSDIIAECEKFGAKACAPEPGKDIAAFVQDLKYYIDVLGEDHYAVGLLYNSSAATFTWVTGVDHPSTPGENGWKTGEPTSGNECVGMLRSGLSTYGCEEDSYFCCSLPHSAD